MEQILTIALISAVAVSAAGVGASWAHREVERKRRNYRMNQALRRGLANPEGVRRPLQVVQWQSCGSTSAHCS